MPSAVKVEKVKQLTDRFKEVEAAVFANFRGLSVQDAGEVRASLAELDTQLSVVKNTLAKLAVQQAKLDGVEAFLEGPTAVAFIKGDPVAAAKALVDAAKKFPVLEVKGGYSEGRVLSGDEIRELASLESREVMLSKIAGLAKAQMSRTAYLLQALQAKLLAVLEAYKEKLPAADAADAGEGSVPPPESVEASSGETEPSAEAEPTPAESAETASDETAPVSPTSDEKDEEEE